MSNTTANRCLEIVSAVFSEKASTNPAINIKHFGGTSRERYLSGDELGRLFEALDHPETPATIKDIVLLALTTGARKGNLLSMSWAEIIDFVFHDLRRTAGSWQAHIGSSDIIIGKSLGHSSTQSTRVYARIRDNNPIKESMAGGFAAMKKASQEKKIANIGDKQ